MNQENGRLTEIINPHTYLEPGFCNISNGRRTLKKRSSSMAYIHKSTLLTSIFLLFQMILAKFDELLMMVDISFE
jgi:hypothetical protein